jgi:hypothetical protein
MSGRRWNSTSERDELDIIIELCSQMIQAEGNREDEEDVASTLSNEMSSSISSIDLTIDSSISGVATMSTSTVVDDDEISIATTSTIGRVYHEVVELSTKLFGRIVNTKIDFEQRPLRIADLNEAECLDDYRFTYNHWLIFFGPGSVHT